jgi:hypothetical protein
LARRVVLVLDLTHEPFAQILERQQADRSAPLIGYEHHVAARRAST